MSATLYTSEISVPRLAQLGGDHWRLSNLSPITILFGKNGSGKSMFLRGWRDSQVEGSHYIIPERTGSLAFEGSYLQQQISPQERRSRATGNFFSEYRQHIVARIQAYFIARGATRAGQLVGDPADLERLLAMLLPDFGIELIGANPPYTLKRSHNQQAVAGIDELSSGEAQLLTLGLDVLTIAAIWELQGTASRVLLIDEPDAHIHPDLQARLADFLSQVADKFSLQVVVATHSTTLLSALGQFSGAHCGIVYFDRTKAEFTAQPFTAALKEISACLGGHALMGPLFGAPILLVEGDDDYRIWSQVPRHHLTNFSVIPCHGDEIFRYQVALEKVFAAVREQATTPAGYALLDGDKALPQPSPGKPQNHVRFIKMDCREAENLYLTDEVTQQFGLTWAQAVPKIAAKASSHGAKAGTLGAAAGWNRQNDDLKNVINEVALAIDEKNVHWTQRVGVALGRSKPAGELATFLGSVVVNALWP